MYIISRRLMDVLLYFKSDGKWDMSVEEWPWNDYPRYFFGNGVLFPGETILPFLAAFQTTPLHPIDDLYFSGICTEKAGVKIRWSTNRTRYIGSLTNIIRPSYINSCCVFKKRRKIFSSMFKY
jgi:hypothetical protein